MHIFESAKSMSGRHGTVSVFRNVPEKFSIVRMQRKVDASEDRHRSPQPLRTPGDMRWMARTEIGGKKNERVIDTLAMAWQTMNAPRAFIDIGLIQLCNRTRLKPLSKDGRF